MLIRMIKRRDRKTILNFLDIVGDDNPYLKNKVHESFNYKQNLENKSDRPTCTTCMMVKIVDLKDIIDPLWKEKLISDDLYDVVIADAERHRDIIWNSILHSLNKKSNSSQCISVLVNALENKYGHIANLLKEETNLDKLQCCCLRRSNQYRKRLPSMSSSTRSSLTNVSVSHVPRIIDLLQQTSLDESSEELEPKLEKLAEKYDISKYIIKTGDGQTIPKVVPNVNKLSCNPATNKDQTTSVVSTNEKEIQTLSRERHGSGNFTPSEESNYISQNQDSKNLNRTVSTSLVPEAGFMLSEYQNMSAMNNNIENTTMLVKENQSNPLAPDIIKTVEKVKRDTSSLPSYSDNSKACEKTFIENRSSSKNNTKPNARRNLYQNQKKCVPTGLLVTKTHIFHSRQSKRSFKRKDNHNQKNLEKKIAQRNLHYNHLWNITNQKRQSTIVNDESEKQISFDNAFTELQKTDEKFDWCTESDDSESPGPSMWNGILFI